MRTTALTSRPEGRARASDGGVSAAVFRTLPERWSVAKLLWASAYIRLTCPEGLWEVHRKSSSGARDLARTAFRSRLLVSILQPRSSCAGSAGSWSRVEFFNRYLLGTVAPRIQLDLIPAIACAAHLLIRPEVPLQGIEGHVRLNGDAARLVDRDFSRAAASARDDTGDLGWYARARRSISRRFGDRRRRSITRLSV